MSRDRDRHALQTNAADPRQVAHGHRASRDAHDQTMVAYDAVMDTPEGRLVIFNILTRLGLFQSVTYPKGLDWVLYRAGRQDFAQELRSDLLTYTPATYLLMEQEAYAREELQARANVAVRTPPTMEGDPI